MKRTTVMAFLAIGAALSLPWPAAAATVIVVPATAAAPAIGMGLLAALACLMALVTMISLRRARTLGNATIAAIGLVLSVATAQWAWATSSVLVQGGNCNHEAEITYNGFSPSQLTSLCPNPIRIAALEPCSTPAETLDGTPRTRPKPDCQVGTVLQTEEACALPLCDE